VQSYANKRIHLEKTNAEIPYWNAEWRFGAGNLEKKMISLKNFERIQELQQQIVWQSVLELEPRTLVPEASTLPPSFSS